MAKLKKSTNGIKEVDIEDLHEGSNVRKDYRDIPEMAQSLSKFGQLQPIGVDKDNKIIFGNRRYRGAKYLLEKTGERIKLKIVYIQGDRESIQMVENLHQSEMTPKEKEEGVEALIAKGMNQREVAEALCLSEQKVSDMRAGHRTRNDIEETGVDTSDLSTSAVSAMRSVPKDQLKGVAEKAKANGGTVKATKEAVKEAIEPKKDPIEDFTEKVIEEVSKAKDVTVSELKEKYMPKVSIECFMSCRNKINGYCTAEKITIDNFGKCCEFEEV